MATDFTTPDLGFALVKNEGAWGGHIIVRVTKRMKRYTTVQTLHEDPKNRSSWQHVTRGLLTFDTFDEAQSFLDGLREAEREFLAKRRERQSA